MISSKMSLRTVTVLWMTLIAPTLASSFERLNVASGIENHPVWRRSADAPVQICGFRLIETIRVVCSGRFRRSAADQGLPSFEMEGLELNSEGGLLIGGPDGGDGLKFSDYSADDLKWQSPIKSAGIKLMDHPRARRTNIINACCNRPCSLNEMRSYCRRS